MTGTIGVGAKQQIQQHLDQKKEERLFNMADLEAISVIDSKKDREQKGKEEAAQRFRKRMEEHQRRYEEREAELRRQEEAYQAQRAENLKGLRKAIMAAGALCGIGGLHLIGAWRPDFAMVAGGVIILSGLLIIGTALMAFYRQ